MRDYDCTCGGTCRDCLSSKVRWLENRVKSLEMNNNEKSITERMNGLETGLNNVYNEFLQITSGKRLQLIQIAEEEFNKKINNIFTEFKQVYNNMDDICDMICDLQDYCEIKSGIDFKGRFEIRKYENSKLDERIKCTK